MTWLWVASGALGSIITDEHIPVFHSVKPAKPSGAAEKNMTVLQCSSSKSECNNYFIQYVANVPKQVSSILALNISLKSIYRQLGFAFSFLAILRKCQGTAPSLVLKQLKKVAFYRSYSDNPQTRCQHSNTSGSCSLGHASETSAHQLQEPVSVIMFSNGQQQINGGSKRHGNTASKL